MEIAGLPLHPLVVHAAVVLIPLTALLAIVVVAAVALPGPSGLASGRGAMPRRVAYADKVLPVLLVLVVLVVLVRVVLTGDSGARAVWTP